MVTGGHYLNCVSKVKPGSRTILIIREIVNFVPNVLQETLEKYEEDRISFPTIMETSDFCGSKHHSS